MAVNAIEKESVKDKSSLEFVEKDHWPVEKYGPAPTVPTVKEWFQGNNEYMYAG